VTPILVFDIETVPDADGIRRVLSFGPELSDSSVVEFALQRRRRPRATTSFPRTCSAW
jgi:predicted PolB exonuclease-like 3'-5' exonuclease